MDGDGMAERFDDGVSEEKVARGTQLADSLRDHFGFDFVGVSITSPLDRAARAWQCVSGNQSTRYQGFLLPEGVGVLGLVSSTARGLVCTDCENDISRRSLYQFPVVAAEVLGSFLAFPLFDDAQQIESIIICGFHEPACVSTRLAVRAASFAAEQTGLAAPELPPRVMTAQANSLRYAEQTHRLIQAQEEERKRIARELHDSLAQELLLVQIELRHLKYLPPDQAPAAVDRANEQLRAALSHISTIAQGLRPAALDELGLPAVIAEECRRIERSFGVHVNASIDPDLDLNPDCELALYRILQEATLNACKYSGTDRLEVGIAQSHHAVTLTIRDFGCGFDTAHPEIKGGGLGLVGMHERAAAFDGIVRIVSSPGQGTTVTVSIPFDAQGGMAQ